MATTTQPTAPAQIVSNAESWLKQHETLIIVFMVLLVTFFTIDRGASIVASWEQHKASVAQQQVDIDKAKNDAALAQAKQDLNAYQNLVSQNEKNNAALQQGIAVRDTLLAAQQKKDITLPPSELGQRWQALVGDTGIQPDASGFTVSGTAAQATVSKLEQVPVLQQDLQDEQEKSKNLQADVDSANKLIDSGKIVVNGLQLQLKDQTKENIAALAAEKSKSRKSALKWFGIGFVSGFIAGHIW